MIKAVFFDFDGTIADTMGEMIKIVNSLSEEFGYKKIKLSDLPNLREKGPREFFKAQEVNLFKIPYIAPKVKSRLNENIDKIKLARDIKPILKKLKNKCKLYLLSANSEENVKNFLESHDIDVFDGIITGRNPLGKHRIIRKLLKELGLKQNEVVYVGDEVRDIEACRKAGVRVASVTWGYNTKNSLKKNNPDYLIDKPSQLLKIF